MKKTIVTLLICLTICSCFDFMPEPHALKYDEEEFNETADLILRQPDIFEMDDFTRYYKSINGVYIKIAGKDGDENAEYLDAVEDSLNLNASMVSTLRDKLEGTKLREFTRSGDTILFIVDGFLDNSWGFFYCKHGSKMDTAWFLFKGNAVKFVEDINKNWKRAAIN